MVQAHAAWLDRWAGPHLSPVSLSPLSPHHLSRLPLSPLSPLPSPPRPVSFHHFPPDLATLPNLVPRTLPLGTRQPQNVGLAQERGWAKPR